MDFDRPWTMFATDAEVEHFGTKRLADAHNAQVAALEQRVEGLERGFTYIAQNGRELLVRMWNGEPWLFYRHPDGQWVSLKKIALAAEEEGCADEDYEDYRKALDQEVNKDANPHLFPGMNPAMLYPPGGNDDN